MRWLGFWLLVWMVPQIGFGWGLSFPGAPGTANVYYQGVNDKLYRLLCEPGAVEDLDCPKDPAFLLKVSLVVSSISNELRKAANEAETAAQKETEKLREQNPDVIALRTKIKASVAQLAGISKIAGEQNTKLVAAQKAADLIEAKLAEISKRLAVEGLPQDELLRLAESRRYFQKQQDANTKIITDLTALLAVQERDRKAASDAIDTNSLALGKLLGTLKVDSKELVELQLTLKNLGDEKVLLTELETRLNDPLPFSVAAWISESGAPGVKALTDRFLIMAARLNGTH